MSMIRLATKLDGDGKPVEWAEYRSVDLSELSLRMADRMDDELRRTPEIGLSCYAEVVQTLAEARMDAHNFAVTLQQEHPDMDVAEAMTRAFTRSISDRRTRIIALCLAWSAIVAGGGEVDMAAMYDGKVVLEEISDPPPVAPESPGKSSGRAKPRAARSATR